MGSPLTLLDGGDPLDATLTPQGAGPGATAAVTMLIDNPHVGSRRFRVQMDVPTGGTNPRFTCTASGGAACPIVAASGNLDQSGDMPSEGSLSYRFEFDLPVDAIVGQDVSIDGALTTLADALAGDRTTPLSAALPVFQAAVPINGAELIPFWDGSGRCIAILLIAGLAFLAVQRNARG